MAEEDVSGGVVEEGDGGDGAGADEWVAPGFVETQAKTKKPLDQKRAREHLQNVIRLSDEQESDIRKKFGYSESETRTKSERDEAAKRMVSGAELPPDIAEVWGADNVTAKALLQLWGPEKFRGSEVHVLAVQELDRERSMADARLEQLNVLQSEPQFAFVPGISSEEKPKRKPKSKGRSETCVHRIAPGNYCKFGCDE